MLNVRQGYLVDADRNIHRLLEGNRRFSAGRPLQPGRTLDTLGSLAVEQHPFAVILGCSDSRVSPEIIFDQGLGDLYVSRIAGPVVDDAVLGSIELAVSKLSIGLIVVLGHERCAAVEAAVRALHPTLGAATPAIWTWQSGWMPVRGGSAGGLGRIVRAIMPAVEIAPDGPGDVLERAIHSNISLVVAQLKASTPIQAAAHRVRVVGGYYSLHTGRVDITVT